MHHFCTLFDSNYLTRGLAMLESLEKTDAEFHLFIFPFDAKCLQILTQLNLKNVTVVSLKIFEDQALLQIKPTRSKAEYCWTCTPSIILYCIEKFNLEACTYLDADLYFYNNPDILIKEADAHSIIITPHYYTPRYDKSSTSGKYCVQFMFFRNDANGLTALKWWRNACIEWCFAHHENGKFGDQKYLDDWTTRFEKVLELKNLGGGVAPWNIQQYKIKTTNKGKFIVVVKKTGKIFPLVFYHFHHLKFYSNNLVLYTGWHVLSKTVKKLIYQPYIRHLENIKENINKMDSSFDPHGAILDFFPKQLSLRDKIYICKKEIIAGIKKHSFWKIPFNIYERIYSYNYNKIP